MVFGRRSAARAFRCCDDRFRAWIWDRGATDKGGRGWRTCSAVPYSGGGNRTFLDGAGEGMVWFWRFGPLADSAGEGQGRGGGRAWRRKFWRARAGRGTNKAGRLVGSRSRAAPRTRDSEGMKIFVGPGDRIEAKRCSLMVPSSRDGRAFFETRQPRFVGLAPRPATVRA